jgi:hypothetical protein
MKRKVRTEWNFEVDWRFLKRKWNVEGEDGERCGFEPVQELKFWAT